MGVYDLGWALFGCFAVTSIELLYRNQRHPFGDRRQKAAAWWFGVVALDCVLAGLMLIGLIKTGSLGLSTTDDSPSWVVAALIGVLGPLALRSPIRKAEVQGRDSSVGITFVYDIARLYALYALDERIVRLRRRDVTQMRTEWIHAGLIPTLIAHEIRAHVAEYNRMDDMSRERIQLQSMTCLSFPDEDDQMEALIKLLRAERLGSLVDEFSLRAKITRQSE